MLYRLLRRYESIENGLIAKDPLSDESVYNHITSSGKVGFQSKFISTCGSLSAVLKFAGVNEFPRIAKIWEKNLPVVKIDLRKSENWEKYYTKYNVGDSRIGSEIEEVLLVGYVPETHVELLTKSDWPASQCPKCL
jgi:hypothetical protein